MMLEFGKFIPGKVLPKIVLMCYLLLVGLSAWEMALVLSWPAYPVLGLLTWTVFSRRMQRCQPMAKPVGILCSFFLYFPFLMGFWRLLCAALQLRQEAEGVGAWALLLACWVLVAYGYFHTKEIRVTRYSIKLEKQASPCRIVCVSDLHLGEYVGLEHLRKLVAQINELHPDLVVIAGDVFEIGNTLLSGAPEVLGKLARELRAIEAPQGVWAVTGNHDPAVTHQGFRAFLAAANIHLLDNARAELPCCTLIGRTDEATGTRQPLGSHSSKPTIVLDHRPEGIEEAAAAGADLILCGHTHRGQFFPATIFTRLANGKDHFYGHHVFGKTHAIITSGAGYFAPPVRLGTSNEVVEMVLTS